MKNKVSFQVEIRFLGDYYLMKLLFCFEWTRGCLYGMLFFWDRVGVCALDGWYHSCGCLFICQIFDNYLLNVDLCHCKIIH